MGDWHADLKLGWRIAQTWESRNHKHIDGIVQVGDFGVSMKWLPWNDLWAGNFAVPFPTLVIMGNHEDPAAIRSWQADPERIVDLTLLPDGGVVDFLGVKIGGIHGNYSPVSYANPERVALHRSVGFEPVGVFKSVGRKFGKWHDVAWFQRSLRDSPPFE